MSSRTIDDRDASIVYSQPPDGRWVQPEDENCFMGTFSRAPASANGATAKVTFQGTSIQVFGSIKPGGTFSSYRMDGASPVKFRNDLSADASKQYKQLFYSSPDLPDGEHTLVIQNLDDVQPLLLDFMVIGASPPPVALSPPPSPSPPGAVASPTKAPSAQISANPTVTALTPAVNQENPHTTGSAQADSSEFWTTTVIVQNGTTVTVSAPFTPASAPSNSPSNTILPLPSAASNLQDSQFPKSTIVGVVIGSAVAIGIVVLLTYCWRSRKRRRRLTVTPLVHPPLLPTHLPTAKDEKQVSRNMDSVQKLIASRKQPDPDNSAVASNPVLDEKRDVGFGPLRYGDTTDDQGRVASGSRLAVPTQQGANLPSSAEAPRKGVHAPPWLNMSTSSSLSNYSRGGTESFDELPPYPETARLSGRFN